MQIVRVSLWAGLACAVGCGGRGEPEVGARVTTSEAHEPSARPAAGPAVGGATPAEDGALVGGAVRFDYPLLAPPDPLPEPTAEELTREREILERDFALERERIVDLQQILSLSPGDTRLRAELGERFYALKLPFSAERELLRAVVEAPASDRGAARAHLLLGDVYRQRAAYSRALWHLERARELAPRDADVLQIEGGLLREVGESRAARELVDLGRAAAPFDPELQVLDAQLAIDAGDFAAAREPLSSALVQRPDHLRAHLLLSQVLLQLGDEPGAEREGAAHQRVVMLKKAGVFDLDHPLSEAQRSAVLASHHLLTGREDLARVELDKSYALEPGNADALVVDAQFAWTRGDRAQALEMLERALVAEPGNVRALRTAARSYAEVAAAGTRAADGPEPAPAARALELADRALALDRNSASTWYVLGLARRAAGDLSGALAAFERALLIDPDSAEIASAQAELSQD